MAESAFMRSVGSLKGAPPEEREPMIPSTSAGNKDHPVPHGALDVEDGDYRGGAYASQGWSGKWAKLQGWLGGTAGHPIDGWLTTTCAQIGQVMLALPNAYAKVGLAGALVLSFGTALCSLWTMLLLISLYVERKKRLIKAGKWSGEDGKMHSITQYHDVIGDLLGPGPRLMVQVVVGMSLFGTLVAQVVASSSDAYYLNTGMSKRQLAILFGFIMQCSVLLPTLQHFRLLNILGLMGTTYTAFFIVATAARHRPAPVQNWAPHSLKDFYVGYSVIQSTFGGHAMGLEIMDSMFKPSGYSRVYFGSFWFIFLLTIPHSVSVQVTWPSNSLENGNVYGVVPMSPAKELSIYLMLLHQVIAFALYSAPLYYMWEKLLHIHHKPAYVRMPLRLPVSMAVALFAIAFPFYGILNSVQGAITSPLIAFGFPATAFSYLYWTKEAQQQCARPPPKAVLNMLGGWRGVHILNICLVVFFVVNGSVFGLAFSTRQFLQDMDTFHIFPECYQC